MCATFDADEIKRLGKRFVTGALCSQERGRFRTYIFLKLILFFMLTIILSDIKDVDASRFFKCINFKKK